MLELKHIKKSYDGVTILSDINLEIQDGEIVSILGPSGCGKTTLLNLILGLTDADEGQILFDGQEMTRLPMEKRGFNIVFQDYALFPNLNVYQNITYGLKNRPGISTKQEVEELIDLLGLREHLAKKIEQLSGGQKQRLSIARAIAKHPRVFIFDDSFSALDLKTDAILRKELAANVSDATVIIVAQRISTILHADQILVMDDGKIVGKGTHEELMKTCETYQQIASSQLSAKELGKEA